MSEDLGRAFELSDADLKALCAKYKLGPRALAAIQNGETLQLGLLRVPCSVDCRHELCVALRRRARRDRVKELRTTALDWMGPDMDDADMAKCRDAIAELARLALGEPL